MDTGNIMANQMDDLISSGITQKEYYEQLECDFKIALNHINTLALFLQPLNIPENQATQVEAILDFRNKFLPPPCEHDFVDLNEEEYICTKCAEKTRYSSDANKIANQLENNGLPF